MAAMSPARKRIAILIVAVGGALIVERVVALSGGEPEISAAVQPRRARAPESAGTEPNDAPTSATAASSVRLDRLDARQRAVQVITQPGTPRAAQPLLFDAVSWQPPAPKVVMAAPPKPVAPPFPYAYMGGLLEDGVRTAFFSKGERALPVKAGETIDAVYRVDEMTDKQMTLTYLPLNETLVVMLGGAP